MPFPSVFLKRGRILREALLDTGRDVFLASPSLVQVQPWKSKEIQPKVFGEVKKKRLSILHKEHWRPYTRAGKMNIYEALALICDRHKGWSARRSLDLLFPLSMHIQTIPPPQTLK